MRRYSVWMVCAVLLACAGSRVYGQAGYGGYAYPPRPAYQQWPTYPAQANPWNGAPQMAYPAMTQSWYPPQAAQPIAYAPPVTPLAAWPRGVVPPMPPATDDPAPAPAAPEAKGVVAVGFRHKTAAAPACDSPACSGSACSTPACAPGCGAAPEADYNSATAFSPEVDDHYLPSHYLPGHDQSAACEETGRTRIPRPSIEVEGTDSGLRGGASLLLLKPFFERNTAFTTTTGVGGTAPATSTTSFDYGYESAVLAWLGYTFDGGLGIRGRYFNLDENAHDILLANQTQTLPNGGTAVNSIGQSPSLPDPRNATGASLFGSPGGLLAAGMGTDQFRFTSALRIRTFDAEIVKELDLGCTTLVFSGGGRYAQIAQRYLGTQSNSAMVANIAGAGTVSESELVHFDQSYYGGGPTVSLQGHIGMGGCGLAFYGSARGSILAGDSRQTFFSSQTITDPSAVLGGTITRTDTNQSRQNDVLPIGEFEVGLEFGHEVCSTTLFLRAGAISQIYWGLGNGSSPDGNLSLFGVQFTAGIGY